MIQYIPWIVNHLQLGFGLYNIYKKNCTHYNTICIHYNTIFIQIVIIQKLNFLFSDFHIPTHRAGSHCSNQWSLPSIDEINHSITG